MIVKQTTKELLAESFRELAKFKAVDKITIRELTQNCGLTSPTFYNHFRDKYDLMAWIYNRRVEASIKNFGRGDSFEDVICKWMEIVLEDENFYANLLKNAVGQNSFRYTTNDHAINLLADWIKTRHNLDELSPEIFFLPAIFYACGLGIRQRLVLRQVGLFVARNGKIFRGGNARTAQAVAFTRLTIDNVALQIRRFEN